ncbi:hypothetical protein ACNKU7_04540 [Microbulbifer sp. SA54]|uniref:hypothetical protein n=1 Tax=Microbulbifer sp. SA54 TaxID=3401577 RepID=UPI003AAA6196
MTIRILSLGLMLSLTACDASVAGPFEPIFENTAAGTQAGDCASWPALSAQVVEGEYDWRLRVFNSPDCPTQAKAFEQTYDMDARFAGLWQDLLLVDSGTGAGDHELYLVATDSGERRAALWYVGQPQFSEKMIHFFEPTRDAADISQCPQSEDVLTQWAQMGMPVMRAVEKVFDSKTGNVSTGDKVSCYVMQ